VTRLSRLALAVAFLGAAPYACDRAPSEYYDDFLARADRRPPDLGDASVSGVLVDIGGREYLMNIALNPLGDVSLRLRILFTSYELDPGGTSATVAGEVRFEAETRADPPVTTFTSVIDENGRMIVDTGHVFVPPERSPVQDTAVEVELRFVVFVLSERSLCGLIDDDQSRVVQPIELALKGTTFGATIIEDDVIPTDVPQACPGASDAGAADAP
jgi:hypothetical protein